MLHDLCLQCRAFWNRQFDNFKSHKTPFPFLRISRINLCLELLLQDVLERHRVRRELGDAFSELLHGHLLLVEEEAEVSLIVDVRLLLNVQRAGLRCVELLGHCVLGVEQILEQVGRDGQVVASSELCDLTDVPEGGSHDNGLVAVLLVIVEDGLDALDTWILLLGVVLLVCRLVPVKDTADEGGDEVGASLGGGDGLDEGEHEGEVGVDSVLGLEDLRSLDAFPGRGDLDQNAVLVDTNLLVELSTRKRRPADTNVRGLLNLHR